MPTVPLTESVNGCDMCSPARWAKMPQPILISKCILKALLFHRNWPKMELFQRHHLGTSERWAEAHVGFPKCIDTLLNWSELNCPTQDFPMRNSSCPPHGKPSAIKSHYQTTTNQFQTLELPLFFFSIVPFCCNRIFHVCTHDLVFVCSFSYFVFGVVVLFHPK